MTEPLQGIEQILSRLHLRSASDLCLHLPLRYEDKTRLTPLSVVKIGDKSLIQGCVISIESPPRGAKRQVKIVLREGNHAIQLRWLNAQPAWLAGIVVGQTLRAYGVVRSGYDGLEMVHPTLLKDTQRALDEALTPVYSTVEGLPEQRVRYWVLKAWQDHKAQWLELLPMSWLKKLKLPRLEEAISLLHQPPPNIFVKSLDDREHPAWQRIKLDELVAQNIALKQFSMGRQQVIAPVLPIPVVLADRLHSVLPFVLTQGQEQVIQVLWKDLEQAHPMHRLLQGDVGSGKTIVAIYAALAALQAGYPVAFMAPTDILATQVAEKARQWLEPLDISVRVFTGGMGVKAKREALVLAEQGLPILWVGTHALFQEKVKLPRLALAIIDEQHRFGVEQRLALRAKAEQDGMVALQPHVLMMSATPIPRTLAMSYYADLDVVALTERPAQRQPIRTYRMPLDRRDEIIEKIRQVVVRGEQVFWVCPLIEASETLDLQAAQDTFEELQQVLIAIRVGLLHGRMSAREKNVIMEAMRQKQLDVLVATTVIEVGIDIPNATMIVIEQAERFGLAQLHQLRGRVGRGSLPSACILLYATGLSATRSSPKWFASSALCRFNDR
jgi:ATP-dependent DNA helicase RecG